VLVWHRNMPPWLRPAIGRDGFERLLAEHVGRVVGRYAGVIPSWDVVNEAVEPEDGRPDGLRDSPWLRAGGFEYVRLAYELAHRADPRAQLVYNDYGCEHDDGWCRRRRVAVL